MDGKLYSKIEDFILDDSFIEHILATSPVKQSRWDEFLISNPACKENFETARLIVLSLKIRDFEDLPAHHLERMISNVQSRYKQGYQKEQQHFKPVWKTVFKYAAIFLFFVILGSSVYYLLHKNSPNPTSNLQIVNQKIINNNNQAILVKLSDNSTVVLSPGAILIHPRKFSGSNRSVSLSGDAFFEVTKDKNRPFFVMSKDIRVKVVGTSFNIKENLTSGRSQVLVSTGKVEVSLNKLPKADELPHSVVILQANEQAIAVKDGKGLVKVKVEKPLPLSMESTRLHFNFSSTPFSEVVTTVEKAYNISIKYDTKVMGGCQLTASLVDQPLDERLRLICKAVEATYHYQDGQVIIEGKGCTSN